MRRPKVVLVRELALTILRRRGRPCRVEVLNARPRDGRFMRALAELVGAWFDRA